MEKRKSRRISEKTGLPPGTLLHIGQKVVEHPSIQIVQYDSKELEVTGFETKLETVKFPVHDKGRVTWIHFSGLDLKAIENLGEQLQIHNLVLEDILNSHIRPKFEDFTNYCFLSMKLLLDKPNGFSFQLFPINFILGPNFVISILDSHYPLFETVMNRLQTSTGRIRKKGADYLFFALADVVVDNYFQILEKGNDYLESVEDSMGKNPPESIPQQLRDFKKELIRARRSILPLKEAYTLLLHEESDLIQEENEKYFRDTQDHLLFIVDQLDYLRDYLSSLGDSYQSYLDNQLNQIMKLLTLVATIFIPLTFLAGIYGMNFTYMPELNWRFGYFVLLSIMLIIAIAMIWLFRKKKWF